MIWIFSFDIIHNIGKGSDLLYWLSKSPWERIESVDVLGKRFHGTAARFQRVIKVIQQT